MVDAIAAGSKWGAEDDTDNNLVVHSLVHRIPNCLLASIDGLPVASFGRTLTFGFGGDSQPIKSVFLPGVPLCFGVGPNGTRKRIAVGHQHGLMVVWPELGGLHVAVACNERPNEHLVWLQGGCLYAVADIWLTRFHVKTIKSKDKERSSFAALAS